jgi:hypothetical protein
MKASLPSVLTGTARRVARHGWSWLRDPGGRREERATASMAAFIMFFPLVVGAFGFGIDIARNIWIRTSIQNAVDTSAVGGAAVTDNLGAGGALRIKGADAIDEMRTLYKLNRANVGLTCLSGSEGQCWIEPDGHAPAVIGGTKITFQVREESKNAFLGFLGQPRQQYNLHSQAKISQATE